MNRLVICKSKTPSTITERLINSKLFVFAKHNCKYSFQNKKNLNSALVDLHCVQFFIFLFFEIVYLKQRFVCCCFFISVEGVCLQRLSLQFKFQMNECSRF